ncbi:MAG: ArsA family ATPase [Thermoproteota archaeon]
MFRELIIPGKERPRFIFFGGKGGVGKSSIAAATAVWLAKRGYKTLLVSTDLQKSQNDILQQEIKGEETSVKGIENLKAINVDAKESIRKHQLEVMKKIESLKGNDWEIQFLKEHWEKNPILPCETASYNVFVEYLNSNAYDVFVFDTAPGGHNFEMIGYPWRHLNNLKRSILAKKEVADITGKVAEVELLEKMSEDNIKAIEKLNFEQTTYLLVLHPEMLPVYEARRIQESLQPYGIKVKGLILNEVLPKEHCKDEFFSSRRKLQEKYIELVKKEFPDLEIGEVDMLETEVVGLEAVERVAEKLYGKTDERR